MVFLFNQFKTQRVNVEEISFTDFIHAVEKNQVKEVTIKGQEVTGQYASGIKTNIKGFKTYTPEDPDLIKILRGHGVKIAAKPVDDNPWYMTLLISWLPMILLIGVWIFFMRQMQSGGGKAMTFGKSKARLLTETHSKITFTDVAGGGKEE